METFTKKKLWTVLLALLVIANLATLVSFWYPKLRGGDFAPGPNPRSDAAKFISKELSFDKKQQAEYDVLRNEHQQKTRSVHDSLRTAKDHFFVSLADSVNHTKLAAEIGRLESELDLLTLHHFQQLRALCNNNQKVKFDEIIQQVLRMMGPKPLGPPPGARPSGPPQQGDGHRPPPPEGMPPPPDGEGPPPQ